MDAQALVANIVWSVDQFEDYGSEDVLRDIDAAGYVLVPKAETVEYGVEWRIAATDRWTAFARTFDSPEDAMAWIERDKRTLSAVLQYQVLRIDRTVVGVV